jgi:hypothetical protein
LPFLAFLGKPKILGALLFSLPIQNLLGATGTNGGIWWPFSSLPELEDIQNFGDSEMLSTAKFGFQSSELLAEVIEKHNLGCDFKRTGE